MSEEFWVDIDGDPRYSVSEFGRVRNNKTGKILRPQMNQQGTPFFRLREGIHGRPHSRSLNILVAEIFVEGQDEIFNTPIHLNGDRTDCHADNLMWRPRWFAIEFHKQFREPHLMNRLQDPIVNDQTGQIYENGRDAVVRCGLLISGITDSIWNRKTVIPLGQTFSFH